MALSGSQAVPQRSEEVSVASAQARSGPADATRLRHIQPASVLGSVVELQPFGNARASTPERSRKARPPMRTADCETGPNHRGHRGRPRHQPPHLLSECPALVRSGRGYRSLSWRQAPARRFTGEEQVARPCPLVFGVAGRLGLPGFAGSGSNLMSAEVQLGEVSSKQTTGLWGH